MKRIANTMALSGILISLALVLSIAEKFLPLSLLIPVPGIKLGLANIITLFSLFYLGPIPALLILILRCVIASLFTGISSLAFSLAGGMLAFAAMYLLQQTGYKKAFSLFGISMGGAVFHGIGQIAAASLVLGSAVIFSYLPFLMLAGLATGFLTALVSIPVFNAINKNPAVINNFPYALKNKF